MNATTTAVPVPGSFRDHRSRVFDSGRILRALSDDGERDFDALASTSFYRRGVASGRLIGTHRTHDAGLEAQGWAAVLEHDRVPVVTYPYEWSFAMLRDAALLQLDLAAGGLGEGITCKDATPYNVQFVGTHPTFIDIGSFEQTGENAWPGYRQFCQLFLYPLMVEAYLGVSFAPWLRGSLDGIAPADASRLLRGRTRLRRGVLSHVVVQAMASSRYQDRADPAAALGGAGTGVEVMEAVVRRTRRVVEGLQAPSGPTEWSDYSDRGHYRPGDLADKDAFVDAVGRASAPELTLDLGCNDGRYARMAAQWSGQVVAVDADRGVVDRLYRSLRGSSLPIVAVVGDLADPSPGLGWALQERTPLGERVDADLVLALALIHHLVITRAIPPERFLDHLASLDARVVLEVPGRDDPMVQRLLSTKPADAHLDYQDDLIDSLVRARFSVEREVVLDGGTRRLYALVPRRG